MMMGARLAAMLLTLSTLRTVDDHCGYWVPMDPLQMVFGNNADYHDIHHQARSKSFLCKLGVDADSLELNL